MLLHWSRLSIKAIPVLSADSGGEEQQVGKEIEGGLQPACLGICSTRFLSIAPRVQGPIGKTRYNW